MESGRAYERESAKVNDLWRSTSQLSDDRMDDIAQQHVFGKLCTALEAVNALYSGQDNGTVYTTPGRHTHYLRLKLIRDGVMHAPPR